MSENLERTMTFYSKTDEALAGERVLAGLDLSSLQRLFGTAGDDSMFDSYPVGPEEAAVLGRFVPEPLDLLRFDYFVECHAPPPPTVPAAKGCAGAESGSR